MSKRLNDARQFGAKFREKWNGLASLNLKWVWPSRFTIRKSKSFNISHACWAYLTKIFAHHQDHPTKLSCKFGLDLCSLSALTAMLQAKGPDDSSCVILYYPCYWLLMSHVAVEVFRNHLTGIEYRSILPSYWEFLPRFRTGIGFELCLLDVYASDGHATPSIFAIPSSPPHIDLWASKRAAWRTDTRSVPVGSGDVHWLTRLQCCLRNAPSE